MNRFINILFFLLFFNNILGLESLAIVTKSIGDVEYKKYSATDLIPKLNSGSELFNEDLIKTKTDGFVKFSYLDDGTTIKMHKNSEVYVNGNISESLINKQINISNGIFNFDISNQDSKDFTIITPTSVASVKGTRFILSTNVSGIDEFYGFDGIVEVLNKESNTTLRLSRNLKITSSPAGDIISEIMTQQDYNITNQIFELEETYESEEIIPDDELDDGSIDGDSEQGSEESTNELRIKIRNEDGEEKELIIKYEE